MTATPSRVNTPPPLSLMDIPPRESPGVVHEITAVVGAPPIVTGETENSIGSIFEPLQIPSFPI